MCLATTHSRLRALCFGQPSMREMPALTPHATQVTVQFAASATPLDLLKPAKLAVSGEHFDAGVGTQV